MENNVVVSDYAAMDRILREERKYILGLCKKVGISAALMIPYHAGRRALVCDCRTAPVPMLFRNLCLLRTG